MFISYFAQQIHSRFIEWNQARNLKFLSISGAWSASFYIGNCIGPLVAGILVDSNGFRWSTQIFFAIFCLIIVIDIAVIFFEVSQRGNKTKMIQEQSLPQTNTII